MFSKVPHPHIKNLPLKPISDIELASCRLTSSTPNEHPSMAMLSDLLGRIQPLQYLQFKLPAGVETIRLEDATHYIYSIKELQLPNRTPKQINARQKRRGRSKEVHITTSLHPLAFKHMLCTACALVEEGKRVEFHLRSKSGEKALTVDWALRNLPYLRPDVILRSMPEGAVIIVPPMENIAKQELIWAVSKRPEDRSDMSPKKRASIIPQYAIAVKKSESLEPHKWQGWREYEEGTAPLFEDHKYIKRPPNPSQSMSSEKEASVTPRDAKTVQKSQKIDPHEWQERRDDKDADRSDEAASLFKGYKSVKGLKNRSQSMSSEKRASVRPRFAKADKKSKK